MNCFVVNQHTLLLTLSMPGAVVFEISTNVYGAIRRWIQWSDSLKAGQQCNIHEL